MSGVSERVSVPHAEIAGGNLRTTGPLPLAVHLGRHMRYLLTNIPVEHLSVPEAVVVLRLRWQVELLFKLWKQEVGANESRSEQPWHVLCDIYAKLVGVLISHWLMIVGCWHIPSRSMLKATRAIRSDVVLIVRALSGKGDLMEVLQEVVEGLETCCMNSRQKAPNAFQLMTPQPANAPNARTGCG